MSRGIIGVTVGTPISPKAIERKIKPVKSVNGFTPDENGNVDVKGNKGDAGVGIQSMEQWYYKSKYADDYKGGSWSLLCPAWEDGYYIWTYTKTTYTDGTTSQTSPICITGSKGATGAPGATPVKGTDYYTEADKAEMVSDVIAALPVYDGSVVSV